MSFGLGLGKDWDSLTVFFILAKLNWNTIIIVLYKRIYEFVTLALPIE
jgi:hypothetical protein